MSIAINTYTPNMKQETVTDLAFLSTIAGQVAYSIKSGLCGGFYTRDMPVADAIAQANTYWEGDIGVEMVDFGYVIFGKVHGGKESDCHWEVSVSTGDVNPYLPPHNASLYNIYSW
jgi:hypothetical protein